MKDIYHLMLRKAAHFQTHHALFTILLLISLGIVAYGYSTKVETVASLENMMPSHVEEIKAFNVLRDNAMGQDMIGIVAEIDRDTVLDKPIADIRDYEVMRYIDSISDIIRQETDIISVYSASDILRHANSGKFPDKEAYDGLIKDKRIAEQLSNFINSDFTNTIIIASTDTSANDYRMSSLTNSIKDTLDQYGHPPGIDIKLTGTPVIQLELAKLIGHDRKNTQWISTLLVFIITAILFGTLTSALVPIIVVTISVTFLYGTMGYFGLPISTLAGGVAAMVIGIGIDYAIHLMNRFRFERRKGNSIKESIEMAVVETGTALTATSLTTMAAFLAFLIGSMPEMGRFGILMAIGVTYSLFFSIFGLPALLVAEEWAIYHIKKKLKFGVEGEFRLEDRKC